MIIKIIKIIKKVIKCNIVGIQAIIRYVKVD